MKLSSTVAAGAAVGTLPLVTGCSPSDKKTKGSRRREILCPFCSLGCGLRIYVKKGRIVHVEGNPDHPVNGGSVCAKAHLVQDLWSDSVRLRYVKYRRPGSSEWESMSWEKALDMISSRIKATRDATFVQSDNGIIVNRTEGIAVLAGPSLTNEEGYLVSKFSRIAGIPWVGTGSLLRGQGRSEAMRASFGLPMATNPWTDLASSDAILILGANPARSMPVAMRHVVAAKLRGAKVITVDPALTESAAVADVHCHVRPGTDTAFILGLINYALASGKINKDYLAEYTDASFILKMDFSYDKKNGRFSGFDAGKKLYSSDSWDYDRDERGNPRRDIELRNVRTVYQTLKSFVSEYTPSYVSSVTGCPEADFLASAGFFVSTAAAGRSGAVIAGSGVEGHASCAQTMRAVAAFQLLCGNIGVSGGGILFGSSVGNGAGVESQISGWTELPGGIPLPRNTKERQEMDLAAWVKNNTPVSNDTMSVNAWQHFKSFGVSLMKAWFGENATKENRFAYDFLPKISADFSSRDLYAGIKASSIKGLCAFG
ncbi:MAG: molybdopterin-dependent oxidoreductase, partial [Spirochaetota bacterium]